MTERIVGLNVDWSEQKGEFIQTLMKPLVDGGLAVVVYDHRTQEVSASHASRKEVLR